MKRKEILETAIKTVCEDRQDQYGDPEDNFNVISDLWGTYLDIPITGQDVAMMMALLKIARIRNGQHKDDNYVDLAGYAACAAERMDTARR